MCQHGVEFALGILPKRGTTETLETRWPLGHQPQGHAVAKTAAKPGKVEQTHSVVVGKEVDRRRPLAQGEPIQQCVGQLATVISNTGGLMLGAWFMATDYVTSPITPKGQFVYGIILGVLTGLFRLFGGSAEGVSYAIIISNLLVPLIERVTLPKPFGKGGEK